MKRASLIAPLDRYRVVKWSDDGSEVVDDFAEYGTATAEADRLASQSISAAVFSQIGRCVYRGGSGPVSMAQPMPVTRLAGQTDPLKRINPHRRK